MQYPSIEEVGTADKVQTLRWWRFLPSPGHSSIDSPEFAETLHREAKIMERIAERMKELDLPDPETSKLVGW